MKHILFSAVCSWSLYIFCGCSSHRVCDCMSTIQVDLSHLQEHLNLSSFIKDVNAIKLELPEPYFFGVITNVLFTDSTLFVVDKKQGSIFRFTKDGLFLNKIGCRGEAPGEFFSLHHVCVDDEYVYVSDINVRKVHYYMHDGTFVKSLAFSFDLVYDDFEILPDRKFLCYDIQGAKGESKIWVKSEKGEKEQTLLYHDAVFPFSYTDWSTITFRRRDNQIEVLDPITCSLYAIDSRTRKIEKIQCLVSDKKGLNSYKDVENLMDVQDEYACPSFVVNTENYLYSIWTISESPGLYSLYEKSRNKSCSFERQETDIAEYSIYPLPVSTNLPDVLMAISTDEYPSEYFPEALRNDISERMAVVYKMNFK